MKVRFRHQSAVALSNKTTSKTTEQYFLKLPGIRQMIKFSLPPSQQAQTSYMSTMMIIDKISTFVAFQSHATLFPIPYANLVRVCVRLIALFCREKAPRNCLQSKSKQLNQSLDCNPAPLFFLIARPRPASCSAISH